MRCGHFSLQDSGLSLRAFRLLGERTGSRISSGGVISKGKNVCLFPSGGLHIFSFRYPAVRVSCLGVDCSITFMMKLTVRFRLLGGADREAGIERGRDIERKKCLPFSFGRSAHFFLSISRCEGEFSVVLIGVLLSLELEMTEGHIV